MVTDFLYCNSVKSFAHLLVWKQLSEETLDVKPYKGNANKRSIFNNGDNQYQLYSRLVDIHHFKSLN